MNTLNRTTLVDVHEGSETLTELSSSELELVRGGAEKAAHDPLTYDPNDTICRPDAPTYLEG